MKLFQQKRLIYYCCIRQLSVTNVNNSKIRNKVVRVRFAPSPTGFLHLGGLRTALYNYLFAKSQSGQFVLRIEDTDQTRIIPGAMKQLEDDLIWAGILPDESPSIKGSYGPYVQSERLHLYQNQAEVLVNKGAAYRCFCSESRLDMLRKEAIRQRHIPGYDNKCRHLTSEEIKEKMNANIPHCIRFKLVPLNESINDLVYGKFHHEINEGDPVIMKQDGYPTYHLANVVDDHMMVITHVLRGVEWQVSTPKHILLYKAFGWDPPQYAHLPLIMNSDGTKLSKRQNDIQVQHYKEQGIFPLTLLNYITKAGGGFNDTSLDDILTIPQLISKFDISLLHSHSCRLSDRLMNYNQKVLQDYLNNENELEKLTQETIKIIKNTFPNEYNNGLIHADADYVKKVLLWTQNRIESLFDLVKPTLSFLWLLPSQSSLQNNLTINEDHILHLINHLNNIKGFKSDILKPELKSFANENKIPFGKLMKDLRTILSGLKEGPGVGEMMEILGTSETIKRLKRSLQNCDK